MDGGFAVTLLLPLAIAALAAGAIPDTRLARRMSLTGIAVAGVAAVAVAALALARGDTATISLETGLPLGPLTLGLDGLSALFLALIGLLLIPAAVFADGYLAAETDRMAIRPHLALFALLAAAMVLVVLARDGVMFLIAWEMLAWTSYLAVVLEVEDRRAHRAGFLMLAVSELGSFGLVVAILVMGGGRFGFEDLATGATRLTDPTRSLVFLGLVVGFGAKIGLLPLQLWLSEAHPAAPSHISAVLSAVIVKLGIYGLIRFAIGFLPAPAPWWGAVLIVVGGVTAIVGILWALFQSDLKRVLAYSTIENVGIITATLGLAELFRARDLGAMASITLVVAVFMVAAHALAKGTLFLAAGAVDRATGTRDLERLGGLLRRMPTTATAILVGGLSIAAIAPFAGYLGEWMILETFLQGFRLPIIGDRVIVVAVGALLALTAATAVIVFVRVVAVGLVGEPRSDAAERASDVGPAMRIAMVGLVLVLLALGFLPTLVLPIIDHAVAGLVGPSVVDLIVPPVFGPDPGAYAPLVGLGGDLFAGLVPAQGLIVIPSPEFSTINAPTYLTLAELLGLAIVGLAVRSARDRPLDRRAPVWASGIPVFRPTMQYTARAYANPVRLIFSVVVPSRSAAAPPRAATGGLGGVEYEQTVPPPLERRLYQPVVHVVQRITAAARVIQSGDINQYVAYIFGIVLLVLILRLV